MTGISQRGCEHPLVTAKSTSYARVSQGVVYLLELRGYAVVYNESSSSLIPLPFVRRRLG
jgi:hypothetical protein